MSGQAIAQRANPARKRGLCSISSNDSWVGLDRVLPGMAGSKTDAPRRVARWHWATALLVSIRRKWTELLRGGGRLDGVFMTSPAEYGLIPARAGGDPIVCGPLNLFEFGCYFNGAQQSAATAKNLIKARPVLVESVCTIP